MFQENAVEMPAGLITVDIENVNFKPEELKAVLTNYHALTISKAFPEYDLADSMIESPLLPGVFAKQPRLDWVYKISIEEPSEREMLNAELNAFEEVWFSDKNGTNQANLHPNDRDFSYQWNMYNSIVPQADINAMEAWDLTQGNSYATIGIIDLGVELDHWEFVNRAFGDYRRGYAHGTIVAGVAAAKGNNNYGIAGVTWNSRIYSQDTGGNDDDIGDDTDIYNAIIDAITNGGVDVLNCSWGGGFSAIVHEGLRIAHDLGILVVAARGNANNDNDNNPATYPGDWVLSVGAMNRNFSRSNFSSYGNGIDLLAPGGENDGIPENDIYTTSLWDGFGYAWGTSLAAPHVSGMVGLLKNFNLFPGIGDNYREVLIRTASDIPPDGYDQFTGFGCLDAQAALNYISRPYRVHTCDCTFGQGPYVVDEDPDVHEWIFDDAPGLPFGIYLAKQYEVRYTAYYVNNCPLIYDELGRDARAVWGLSPFTNGWGPFGPNDGARYCGVVDFDHFGVTLNTFVYQVWTTGGRPLGFFPNHWSDCQFSFTVVADETPFQPAFLSVGPTADFHPIIRWTANPHSAYPSVSGYKVYRKVAGIENDWVLIGTTGNAVRQFIDWQYSTPHDGPIAYWTSLADYTVTAFNDFAESEMPTPVTIKVVTPENPKPPSWKLEADPIDIPDRFALLPAYPNPFNAQTNIEYWLPKDSYVDINIYNISGQKVKSLLSEQKNAGRYTVNWDASDCPSGIYLCKIEASEFHQLSKLTLMK